MGETQPPIQDPASEVVLSAQGQGARATLALLVGRAGMRVCLSPADWLVSPGDGLGCSTAFCSSVCADA